MENNLDRSAYFNIKSAFYFGLSLVFLLCIFLFFPAERAVANSHDYLDHWFSFYSIWGRSGQSLFDLNYMVNELDGYPLNALAFSEFNFAELMYRLFPPISAHSIIASFILIVAFIGSFLLLKDYFVDERTLPYIVLILSLALFFAFLPHKTIRVLGSAGIPLFIWAILNVINSKKQFISVVLILSSPFFVYLPYGGLTNLIVFFLLWFWLVLIKQDAARRIFFLMVSLVFTYVVVVYRSIYHLFLSGYEFDSSRNYMFRSDLSSFNLSDFWPEWGFNLLYIPGQHHTTGINNNIMVFLWSIIFISLLVSMVHIFFQKNNNIENIKEVKTIVLLIIFVSIASAIKVVDSEYFLLLSLIGMPLQLQRIDTLSLTFIVIICAISFKILLRVASKKIFSFIMALLLIIPMISLSYAYGLRYQVQETFGISGFGDFRSYFLSSSPKKKYSIKNMNISDGRHRHAEFTRIIDYLEVNAFNEIKNDLIRKKIMTSFTKYGTLSIGLSPSVAWYHGFRTFDGRFYDEPVKKIFNMQKIFESEYEKDDKSISNVMNSMSYISKYSLAEDGSISPDINIPHFVKMNGKVIFSLYSLKNYKKLNIKLFGVYQGTVDPIYVYITNK